jgi:hypothetical protein
MHAFVVRAAMRDDAPHRRQQGRISRLAVELDDSVYAAHGQGLLAEGRISHE